MRANDILLQLLGIYGQACNNYYRPIYMKRITARACVNISGPAVIFFVKIGMSHNSKGSPLVLQPGSITYSYRRQPE